MSTKISATIVAHSLNMAIEDRNKRYSHPEIATFEVVFPRYILAELNTHRMFSRNSASSRAIPFKKMVEMVQTNPFVPIAWQTGHIGMQGTEYCDEDTSKLLDEDWKSAAITATAQAMVLTRHGSTKQLANRLLEPFMWHKVIITATEFNNFFALRCPQYTIHRYDMYDTILSTHVYRSRKDLIKGESLNGDGETRTYIHENDSPSRFKRGAYTDQFTEIDWLELNKGMADIHMMALAEAMWDAFNESTPKQLQAGEWHIPYEDKINIDQLHDAVGYIMDGSEESDETFEAECIEAVRKVSTAMCARVSYTIVGEEKELNYVNLIKLHDEKLIPQDPLHASPMEHCNQAMSEDQYYNHIKGESLDYDELYIFPMEAKGWCANMHGFIPYRMQLPNENIPG